MSTFWLKNVGPDVAVHRSGVEDRDEDWRRHFRHLPRHPSHQVVLPGKSSKPIRKGKTKIEKKILAKQPNSQTFLQKICNTFTH